MHASPRRQIKPSRLGLAAAGTVVLVTAGVLLRLEGDACAAVFARDTAGQAFHYTGSGGDNRCSFGALPADGMFVSLAAADYGQADLCGSWLDVAGPDGRQVRVQVVDRCAGCADGALDMGDRAFAKLAPLSQGRLDVRWRRVRDPFPAPPALAVRVKPASNAHWLGLIILGHANPLRSVEARSGDGWRPLTRGLDNHWVLTEPGGGPYTLRVTDAYDNQKVLPDVNLTPGLTQTTGLRMYGGAAPAAVQSGVPAPPVGAALPPEPPLRSTPHCG
ncbi:hypothetical protein GCM10027589_53420 [Actinocorallia lasiicapitis]